MAGLLTPGGVSDPLAIKALRLTPTTIQGFLPAGMTDPYIPTDFNNGAQTTLHVRVSPFNSAIKCLPRAAEGTIVYLVHAGDGGSTTAQSGMLSISHMAPAYDGSAGGDNSTYCGFYCPGQRDIQMFPADCLTLRMDTGHTSWRVIGMTNSGRSLWSMPNLLGIAYPGIVTLPTLAAGDNDLLGSASDAECSVWRIVTDGAGSNIVGMRPPLSKYHNGSVYKPHAVFKMIYNTGPGTLIIKMNASASAEYKIVGDGLLNHAIPIWGSRWFMYDPIHGFWLLSSKP